MGRVAKGQGGAVVFTNVYDADGTLVPTAQAQPAAWKTAEPYQQDDTVKAGSKFFVCRLNHTSLSTATDGRQSPTATNTYWTEIAAGEIIPLQSWSISGQTSNDTFGDLKYNDPRTLPGQRTRTGQLVLGAVYLDNMQKDVLLEGYTGAMTIYPRGVGAGKPKLAFQADVSNREEGGSHDAVSLLTVSFTVDGPVDRTPQT